jgi:hypothetical protein
VYVNKKHVLGACKSRSWARMEDTILDYLGWKREREGEGRERANQVYLNKKITLLSIMFQCIMEVTHFLSCMSY